MQEFFPALDATRDFFFNAGFFPQASLQDLFPPKSASYASCEGSPVLGGDVPVVIKSGESFA